VIKEEKAIIFVVHISNCHDAWILKKLSN